MPPILAVALTLLFIGFLFWRDYKQQYTPSLALSIVCIWMLILGSRSVTEWLYLGEPISGGGDITEGDPLNRAVFFFLMGAGVVVLVKRGISWSQVFRNNIALTLFVLYCGISIVWSDFPFVAFKRWFKGFGDPIMVLIILTDLNPLRAAEIVLRTCTNILVPLSVLFIRYYSYIGRTYSDWTGDVGYTGVTTNKNILGFTLMVFSLFLVWRLYSRWGQASSSKMDNIGIPLLLLGMIGWLFSVADSKTSLLSLGLAVFVFSILGLRTARAHVTAYLVAGVLMFAVLQWSVDIKTVIAEGAGRDATFTGRTELWDVVLQMQQHPVLGFGLDSFWLGERLKTLQDRWYFKPNQAHSGYIELYLNLGWVGWAFFAGVIVSYYRKSMAMLTSTWEMTEWVIFARLGLGFLGAYLIYNYTEAAFKTPHFLYVIFLLFAIKYAQSQQMITESSPHSFSGGTCKVPRMAGNGDISLVR